MADNDSRKRRLDLRPEVRLFPVFRRSTVVLGRIQDLLYRNPPADEPKSIECTTCLPDKSLPQALELAGLPDEKIDAVLAIRFRHLQGIITDGEAERGIQRIISSEAGQCPNE
jgi:hypothetical protein